jgi:LytS/YehU family sensor histidine kinase
MAQAFPIQRPTLGRDLSAYLLTAALLLWLQQLRFFLLGGFGSPPGHLGYAANAIYFVRREGIFYFLIYLAMVLLLRGLYAHRRMQRMALQASQLQQEVTRLELLDLRSRLQPHTFFNALNTISSFVHDDPNQADEMIELLAGWMRRNLDYGDSETTPLAEELKAAKEYLQLQKVRFRSRMDFRVDTLPEIQNVLVPSRILQPIVENCVKHGVECSSALTQIGISSETDGRRLIITVRNTRNGPSIHRGLGSGLKWVEKRIHLLYGDRASLSAEALDAQYRIRLTLPLVGSNPGPEVVTK